MEVQSINKRLNFTYTVPKHAVGIYTNFIHQSIFLCYYIEALKRYFSKKYCFFQLDIPLLRIKTMYVINVQV